MTKLTLLYAEDDQETRENYAYVLKEYFTTVYTAKNAEEALSIYHEKKPDILLLDIKMSDMNGLELAKIIREENKDIPIIMLTAYSEHGLLMSAINLKLEKYLLKPIDDFILKDTMLKLISRLENKDIINLCDGFSWERNNSMLLYKYQHVKLTKKERLLIQFLAKETGKYFGRDVLILHIWYDEISDKSHETKLTQLISRLNKKIILETGTTIQLVENSYALGYRLDFKSV